MEGVSMFRYYLVLIILNYLLSQHVEMHESFSICLSVFAGATLYPLAYAQVVPLKVLPRRMVKHLGAMSTGVYNGDLFILLEPTDSWWQLIKWRLKIYSALGSVEGYATCKYLKYSGVIRFMSSIGKAARTIFYGWRALLWAGIVSDKKKK